MLLVIGYLATYLLLQILGNVLLFIVLLRMTQVFNKVGKY